MRRGYMLLTVMLIAAIGLLFGAGALLMFRYQCQLRIDRQHELEKVYAVRSVLNYVRTGTDIPDDGKDFRYHTSSERDLNLKAKPVAAIFPSSDRHFAMERDRFESAEKQYVSRFDYEYGSTTNLKIRSDLYEGQYQLVFYDFKALRGEKWWVNIGMRGTGGWLQEDYGRRYYFIPRNYAYGDTAKDVMRLCIIRNTNMIDKVGRQHGWPLSKGQCAIVFQISPRSGDSSEMTLSEFTHTGAGVRIKHLTGMSNCPSLPYMGLQLAGRRASVFYVDPKSAGGDPSKAGYVFSDVAELSPDVYEYFREGIYTNDVDGKVYAPELRAVFEVEAVSDKRPEREGAPTGLAESDVNRLTRFRVTPAYQYDIFIEHPQNVTNRATVAQKMVKYGKTVRDTVYSVRTYDTHGTEHKGFRRDERDWAREQARRKGR